MKNYLGITLLLSVALLFLACNDKTEKVAATNQTPTAATLENTPNLDQEVMAFEKRLDEASRKNDIGFYEQTLAPEYLLINEGRTITKAQVLEIKKGMDFSNFTTEFSDIRAKAYGNVVVVTGQQTVSQKDKEGKPNSTSARLLQVLTKSDGQWKLLAATVSRIEPNAMSK